MKDWSQPVACFRRENEWFRFDNEGNDTFGGKFHDEGGYFGSG